MLDNQNCNHNTRCVFSSLFFLLPFLSTQISLMFIKSGDKMQDSVLGCIPMDPGLSCWCQMGSVHSTPSSSAKTFPAPHKFMMSLGAKLISVSYFIMVTLLWIWIKAAVPWLLSWCKKESCISLCQLRMWFKLFGFSFPCKLLAAISRKLEKMLTSASWGQEGKIPENLI